ALREYHAPLPGQRRAETPEALAELRALGYVSGSAAARTKYTEADDPKRLIDLDAAIHTAVEAFGARRIADAVQIYERVIARRPDMAIAYRHLAVNPDSSIPLENLGVLALERGDIAAARRHLERAVNVDPRSSRAHADLGVVALKSGDRQAAVAAWQEAVRLDPTNYDALYNLGTTIARGGDMNTARPYLEQFLRTAPPAFYAKDLREIENILRHD